MADVIQFTDDELEVIHNSLSALQRTQLGRKLNETIAKANAGGGSPVQSIEKVQLIEITVVNHPSPNVFDLKIKNLTSAKKTQMHLRMMESNEITDAGSLSSMTLTWEATKGSKGTSGSNNCYFETDVDGEGLLTITRTSGAPTTGILKPTYNAGITDMVIFDYLVIPFLDFS
jgi:hypothetical protein